MKSRSHTTVTSSLHSVPLLVLLLLSACDHTRPALAQDAETATNVIDHRETSATESALRASTLSSSLTSTSSSSSAAPLGTVPFMNGTTTSTGDVNEPRDGNAARAGDAVDDLVEQMLSKTAQQEATAPAGSLGLTLGDLEDLRNDEPNALTGGEPLRLEETVPETTTINAAAKTTERKGDSRNIYRVTAGRPASENVAAPATMVPAPSATNSSNGDLPDGFGAFEVYKRMFDQSEWQPAEMTRDVSADCARDVRLFLADLKREETWALRGKHGIAR